MAKDERDGDLLNVESPPATSKKTPSEFSDHSTHPGLVELILSGSSRNLFSKFLPKLV